jgi:hypothetical protein
MTIFEPYAHQVIKSHACSFSLAISVYFSQCVSWQVAGHCSIFKLDGMVCKPLIPREYEFYQTIYREFPPLVPLTPEFHGSITIHKKTNNQDTLIKISPADKCSFYRNPSIVDTYLNITLLPPESPPNNTSYIVLEDLTAGMSKPCAMDMKVCADSHNFFH